MRPLGLNMGERLGVTPEGICALGMRSKACSRTKYWSTPYSKFRAMKESPYREMERSESSRGMPLSSISSGMVTRRSISSGAWPGHWVLLDDLVNQLANFGLQPDFAALRADERRDVFKFVELVTPLLPVGDVLGLQTPSALSTDRKS